MKKLSTILITALLAFQTPFVQVVYASQEPWTMEDPYQKSWFTRAWERTKAFWNEPRQQTSELLTQTKAGLSSLAQRASAFKTDIMEYRPNWNWGNIAKLLTAIAAATGFAIVVYNKKGELMQSFGDTTSSVGQMAQPYAIGSQVGQLVKAHPYVTGAVTLGTLEGGARLYLKNAALNLLKQHGDIKYGENSRIHNINTLLKLEKSPEATSNTAAYREAKEMLEKEIAKQPEQL